MTARLVIRGNPGWAGPLQETDGADADIEVEPFEHGGSVATVTLRVWPHSPELPAVEVGMELTPGDCSRLMAQLARIVPRLS